MNHPGRLVLLGHPVGHSLSPVMHNAALAAASIPLRYEAIDVEARDLLSVFASLARETAAGNVTIPYKESASRLLPRLSSRASEIGAVNTFSTMDDGELAGDNTDVAGFVGLVRHAIGEVRPGSRFAVLGAGGGAAAVLAAIAAFPGASAVVYARNHKRAESLAARFKSVARAETLRPGHMLSGEVVVNATPVGLADDEFPVPLSSIAPDAVVLDLVYRTNETAWVRAARASGRVASDGLPMLIEQGVASFKIWFGIEPDREAMWWAVRAATGGA